MRRSHHGLSSINSVECPNCGELKLSHHVCSSCGYYNKKSVIIKENLDEDSELSLIARTGESLKKIVLAIDVMGGDHGPQTTIQGVVLQLKSTLMLTLYYLGINTNHLMN